MANLKNQIANQAAIERSIRDLFRQDVIKEKSPLTPTQRFIVSDLKGMLVQKDGGGKDKFQHWELRALKGSRAILLASVIGKVKRYILIGPRGSLKQIDDDSEYGQLMLAEVLEKEEAAGNA